MTELTIGDKTVTVDDAFLKLSPEQQNATVQQIAGQLGAQAAGPAPVSANDVVRATATGVPIIGGALNKLNAATNAALAPLLNRFFDEKDQLPEANFSDRMAHSERDQAGADKRFAKDHPIVNTAANLAGGVAGMVPAMSAAPAAFGLTGTLPQMVARGAASGAAVSGADAAVRGENPVEAAATGGIIGGAAGPVGKGVGKVVASIADRLRPPAPVAQNVARVGDVEVPMSGPQVSQNAADSAEAEIMRRGGRGDAAQEATTGFDNLQRGRVDQAREGIAGGLGGTESPNDAAERIAADLIAQEQARTADEAAQANRVNSEGASLARNLGGGSNLAASPGDAAEILSDRFAAARGAAKADYRGKYDAVAEQPGEFAPGSAAGFRNDVEKGLANADRPVSLDETNTRLSNKALDVIDQKMNAVGPGKPALAEGGALGVEHAKNVDAIRAKFGEDVAAVYDRQKQAAAGNGAVSAQNRGAAPKAQSLIEFLASKGGLGPDAELEAIGAHGHTVNVEGAGRRKLVRQGGWPLDYAREAAEEAGYLHGDHNGTSTVNDLLDAMDAEMRGQKRYPQGFEGHVGKRERAAMSEREQHELDQHNRGFEDDLAAAGHGELGPDVKARAVHLMANEGHNADSAVEHALAQLEQEDAAGVERGAGFPGDRPASPAATGEKIAAAAEKPGSGFTMRDVDQVRKQLSTLYGDARRSMMMGGSGSDVYALEHIMDQFDARVRQMVKDGKFSGDGPAVLKMQEDARASFADYKQKFARRGSGDDVGSAVEKILGKFSDTKATPDAVVKLAYGNEKAPGGEMPVKIAQRIASIFGKSSPEFSAYKQGLFAALKKGEPAEAAARIKAFLSETKGNLLSQTVFSADERAALSAHADRLQGIAPKAGEKGPVADALRRYSGADGGPAASPNKIINDLMGASGTGTGVNASEIAAALKGRLSPERFNDLRRMAFEKLTRTADGKIDFEAQALSQRMHEFLNGKGARLAETLYSPRELELMRQLASVYKQMIPVKGTTNPSGTAPMLAKMAGGIRHSLLPLIGLHGGGIPGALAGYAADKGLSAVINANNARKATDLFYGPQARRPVNGRFARLSGLLAQGSQSSINERRSK